MRGLFVNSNKASCSIYESNCDIYNILSKGFELEYVETTSPNIVRDLVNQQAFNYVTGNYHPTVSPYMTKLHMGVNVPVIGFHLETLPGNVVIDPSMFDVLCVMDPSIKEHGTIFVLSRPILDFVTNKQKNEVPIIGYNGFVAKGKSGEQFANAVTSEFKKGEVIVRLNFPLATYIPLSSYPQFSPYKYMLLIERMLNGIETVRTTNYFTKQELISWVASCDLMIYHYQRSMTGLSATIDQAIAAETPFSISEDCAFRHLHPHVGFWPKVSLRESMQQGDIVRKIKQDWSEDNFRKKFSEVLDFARGSKL